MSVIVTKTNDINLKFNTFKLFSLLLISILLINGSWSISTMGLIFLSMASFSALKRFSYSFWSLNILFGLFFVIAITNLELSSLQSMMLIPVLIIYLAFSFSFFSPIYYPIINWFEYDFRYRHDLPFFLCLDNGCFESRLMDFRRNEGSFHSFLELDIGDTAKMIYRFKENQVSVTGTVVSIRQNSLGRGLYYGIRFDNSDGLNILSSVWKVQKTYSKKLKKLNR